MVSALASGSSCLGSSPGRGHCVVLKALANEDAFLPTQMFSRLPTRATFVADTTFVSRAQKNVSDFVQKHFVFTTNVSRLRNSRKFMGNNVSATICPHLLGPLGKTLYSHSASLHPGV